MSEEEEKEEEEEKKEESKPIRLGRKMKMKLEYIPFSQLIEPWEMVEGNARYFRSKSPTEETIPRCNSRPLSTIKSRELKALRQSIFKYGLRNPLSVVELTEDLKEKVSQEIAKRYGDSLRTLGASFSLGTVKGKYIIVDGQRRYFAIKELYNLRSAEEIEVEKMEGKQARKYSKSLGYMKVTRGKKQSAMEKYILVPCIVYEDYDTLEEMRRHSIEDNKFSVRPSTNYLDIAERE